MVDTKEYTGLGLNALAQYQQAPMNNGLVSYLSQSTPISASWIDVNDLMNAAQGQILRTSNLFADLIPTPEETAARQSAYLEAMARQQQNEIADIKAGKRMRAEANAAKGERIMRRLAFWIGFGSLPAFSLIARLFLERLAAKLDVVSDNIERCLA
jgi:hypothetical protein